MKSKLKRRSGVMGGFGTRVVLVVAGALVATCLSIAPSSASTLSSKRAPTGTPISIGTIGSFSSPTAGQQLSLGESVLKDWVRWINGKGGLAGHRVKLYVKDDGGNSTTALQAAQSLVTEDHVVAILDDGSTEDTTWANYVQAQKIPVVGGLALNTPFITNTDFFSTGANIIAQSYGMMRLAKEHGDTVGVLYCAELQECAELPTLYKLLGSSLGMTVPLAQSVSATATSYVPSCEAILNSGVKSYEIGTTATVAAAVANQCKSSGVTATPVSINDLSESYTHVAGLQGLQAAIDVAPWVDTANPAIAQFRSVVGSGSADQNTYSWAAGQLFAAAVKASKSADVTSASVLAGLYALPSDETLGGLTAPLHFTEGQFSLDNCYFQVAIKNHKYVSPAGSKYECAPDAVVNKIAALLR
jgi:branched-chain amino acid transport system substrate-binding protein